MEQTATERVTLTELDNTAAMVQGAEFPQAFEAQNYLENFAHWWFSNQLYGHTPSTQIDALT